MTKTYRELESGAYMRGDTMLATLFGEIADLEEYIEVMKTEHEAALLEAFDDGYKEARAEYGK